MLPVNKHFTIVIGIDLHFTTLPPFNPVHPFIGIVFDVADLIPFVGCNTFVNGIPKGSSDTSGKLGTMKHIPIASGAFAMMAIMGNECMNFYGGQNTHSESRRLTPAGYMIMTCNDIGLPLALTPGKKFKPEPTLFAPTSFTIPIPTGPPVILGGPYVPDLGAMLMNLVMGFGMGCLMKGAGKLIGKIKPGKIDIKAKPKSKTKTKTKSKTSSKSGKTGSGKTGSKSGTKTNSKSKSKTKGSGCNGRDPVDLVTGNVLYDGIDFELPGPLPLVWSRQWASDSRWDGVLGHGCHWRYDMRIATFQDDDLTLVTLPEGHSVEFPYLNQGEYDINTEEKLALINYGDHHELFNFVDRISYIFPVSDTNEYILSQVRNEAGHSINFIYRGGHISGIIDSAGRIIHVKTDKDKRIKTAELVVENNEREKLVEYTYNSEGDLIEISDALDQSTRIVYQNHLMIKKTDRNGQSFYWEYDGSKTGARCIHTWGDGGLLRGHLDYHKGYNLLTDSLGNTTKYVYNDEDKVIAVTDPLGSTQLNDYNQDGNLIREIDAEGNMTGYDYNKLGQVVSILYPNGGKQLFQYDEEGRLICETTPEGASTIYDYNQDGLLEYLISPDNQVTQYLYNDNNLIKTIVSEKGDIELEYDNQYNIVKATFPDGIYAEWEYDIKGKLIRSKTPVGEKTRYYYDSLGRVIQMQTPDGNTVKLKYNAYDEIIVAEDKDKKIELEYTPLGSLKKRTENGKTISFSYNTEEQLTTLRNENKEIYSFGRDKAGRIVRETGFDGLIRKYERSANGDVIHVEKTGGHSIDYVYDNIGNLCGVEYNDGSFEQYAYDKDGRMIEAKNNNSHLKILRNKSGNITEEYQDGHIVTSHYDKSGQRKRITSSLGADITIGYTPTGMLKSMSSSGWEMLLKHDERGLELERILNNGVISRNEYDSIGRISRHTVKSGNYITRQMSYKWGINDKLISITNELANSNTWFDYDTIGNLTGALYKDIEKIFRIPDAVGNIYKTKDCKDRKYGPGGRLLESENTRYHYDDQGNIIEKVKVNGERWSYIWNVNGSLKEVIRPDRKKVCFEYDAIGRRTAKIFNGIITRWVWDGNTPIHEWSYKLEDRPQTIRDEFGFESKDRDEPINDITTWVFDEGTYRPSAKLTEKIKYSIITDYLGTPTHMYDDTGVKMWEVELDIYGKVRNFEGSSLIDCPFRYQGQYEDVETGLYYNRFRYYDPNIGSYLSQDPIGLAGNNPTLYGYVHDPNAWIDIFGLTTEFKIGAYGDLTGINHRGDKLTGHELLQSAWLKENYGITRTSDIGALNPSIAITEPDMHKKITVLQNRYNMKAGKLRGQSALQNINRNTALTRRGIYEGLLERGWERSNAKRYATELTMELRGDAIAFAKKQGYIKCNG